MADNYLENKYEEFKAQQLARKSAARKVVYRTHPDCIEVNFPPRRVFVTGGANGIGRAIVAAFRKANCQVAFCDIDSKAGNATAQQLGARFYPLDVTDTSALEQCLADIVALWGDVDVIINNVGVGEFKPLEDTIIDDFNHLIAVNLRPVFVTSRFMAIHRRSLPQIPGYGRIVNICSTRYLMSEPGTIGYSASKGAVAAITHSLMASMSGVNVTVNAISPGWIQTIGYEALTEADHAQHPSRRVGKPDDIANVCLFLCRPDSDFINGENIVVDGGMTRKMIYVE